MPAVDMLAHALKVNSRLHLCVVAREVEPEPPGVAAKLVELEMRLVLEQEVVHRPEPPLRARGFGGKSRVKRMWMHPLERKMAKRHPEAREAPQEQLHRGRRLPAVWALEVTVLDQSQCGMHRTDQVVCRADGRC